MQKKTWNYHAIVQMKGNKAPGGLQTAMLKTGRPKLQDKIKSCKIV